ncbi:MAG: archease [Nitrospirae bacterium]|nr:archease [Nitrospirota bacterium]
MKTYETFEHRADIGIRGYGKRVEDSFENGARAMFSVMADIDAVRAKDRKELICEAFDVEYLFVEWLNNLLSLSHLNGMVFSSFKVEITGNKLKGSAWGEHIDTGRHKLMTEVKAATYSMLKVSKEDEVYVAQCVVDV